MNCNLHKYNCDTIYLNSAIDYKTHFVLFENEHANDLNNNLN